MTASQSDQVFLTKPVQAQVLVAAVRAAIDHHASVRRALAETADLRQRLAGLTWREREVLAALMPAGSSPGPAQNSRKPGQVMGH